MLELLLYKTWADSINQKKKDRYKLGLIMIHPHKDNLLTMIQELLEWSEECVRCWMMIDGWSDDFDQRSEIRVTSFFRLLCTHFLPALIAAVHEFDAGLLDTQGDL